MVITCATVIVQTYKYMVFFILNTKYICFILQHGRISLYVYVRIMPEVLSNLE